MRFSCTVASLREAVAAAAAAVPAAPTQVAYSALQLSVETSAATPMLAVTGTDGDTTVSARVEVSDAEAGVVLLPPKQLSAWLGQRDARHVLKVEAGAESISVRPEKGGAYSFRTLAAQLKPPVARGEAVPASLASLKAAVSAVRAATDRRSPLVHVSCSEAGGMLTLQATDMYRVARARIAGGGWGEFEGVLPLAALERIVRAEPEQVAVDDRARMLRVVGGGVEVSARLSAASFPSTDGMFEHAAVHQVTAARSDLAGAAAGVAAVAVDATVKVSVSGALLVLEADNADTGSGSEQVPLSSASEQEVTLHLKPQYLSDALAAVPGSTVMVGWSAPNAAVLVSGSADGLEVASLVMPVRVTG